MKITPYKLTNFVFLQLLNRIQKIKDFPPSFLCFWENFASAILRKGIRFSYDKDSQYFIVSEGHQKRFFSVFERGTWLYRNGISLRSEFLFKSYCLQNLSFKNDDVVIDCGANSGDLTLKLFEACDKLTYVGVEPSPNDYEVLKKNVSHEDAHLVQKALGDKDGNLKFYICSDRGDSSLIEPPSYNNVVDVEVVTLENLVKSLNLEAIKLIKIEAEGFEPEILQGAKGILDKVEYIAVDGGYERGIDCEQTLTTVTNFLLQNDFEMVDIYFPWYRALFRNKSAS